MDPMYVASIAELGVSLATLAAKGTALSINTRVKAAKEERDLEKAKNTYEEIINELISEREQAIMLAQVYKAELDRIVISDEDIEHLNATVSRLLEVLRILSPGMDVDSFGVLKELISVDTLKTMQLLGFNYKAAIGEPLTKICADTISSMVNKRPNTFTQSRGKKP